MKIIAADNFARESVADTLLAENVSEHHAKMIADALNEKFCNHDQADRYFKAVADDYKLSRGMEDLI